MRQLLLTALACFILVAYCSEVMREQAAERRDTIWVWRTLR